MAHSGPPNAWGDLYFASGPPIRILGECGPLICIYCVSRLVGSLDTLLVQIQPPLVIWGVLVPYTNTENILL